MGKLGFTEEELEERISDIHNHYLTKAIENNDKEMIKHWTKILQKYEQNLAYLRSIK